MVRGTLERTDCLSFVHLSVQQEPSSDCWDWVGWSERLIRVQVLPSFPLGHPRGIQEDGRHSSWPQDAHGLIWEDETNTWRG